MNLKDKILDAVVDKIRGKSKDILETVVVSNEIPSAKEYLKSPQKVENTRKTVDKLYKEMSKNRRFKTDFQILSKSFEEFNTLFTNSSQAIGTALGECHKNLKDAEEATKEYKEAIKLAEAAYGTVSKPKADMEKIERESSQQAELAEEFKEQIGKSKEIIRQANATAEEELATAKAAAEQTIAAATRDAELKIAQFQQNAEQTLAEYMREKGFSEKELREWNSGKYEWNLGGATVAAFKGFFKKGKDTGEKAKKKYENAKAAYKLRFHPEDFMKEALDGDYGEELEAAYNLIADKQKPKFKGAYKKLEGAWLFIQDKPKFKGDYEQYESAYLFTQTPRKFKGKYEQFEEDYMLIQPTPDFKTFNSKYDRFKAVAKGSGKVDRSGIKSIGQENEHLFSEYVKAMDKFNRAKGNYDYYYRLINEKKELIRGGATTLVQKTETILKEAANLLGDPSRKVLLANVKAAKEKGQLPTSKLTIPEAVAVVNGIMNILLSDSDKKGSIDNVIPLEVVDFPEKLKVKLPRTIPIKPM